MRNRIQIENKKKDTEKVIERKKEMQEAIKVIYLTSSKVVIGNSNLRFNSSFKSFFNTSTSSFNEST